MTTAGRFLLAVWSVKGNGTRTTSPNSKAVVLGIVGVVPDLAECALGQLRDGPGQPTVGISLTEEVHEVLHFGKLVRWEGAELVEEGLVSSVSSVHGACRSFRGYAPVAGLSSWRRCLPPEGTNPTAASCASGSPGAGRRRARSTRASARPRRRGLR